MQLKRKEELLVIVGKKIGEIKVRISKLEQARNSAESAMTSRFDTQRESLEMEAGQQRKVLSDIEKFKIFLETSKRQTSAVDGSEVTIQLENEPGSKTFICSPVLVGLDAISVLTFSSPLGKALEGKKAKDEFSYSVNGTIVKGYIMTVE